MKLKPGRLIALLAAGVLLLLGCGTAVGGGRVDTGPAVFGLSDFTDSEYITNTWWTLAPDDDYHNYLYFAQDGDECEWNLMEVLEVLPGEPDADGSYNHSFAAPYTGVQARIILDRAWVEEDCDYEDEPDAGDFSAFVATNPPVLESTYDWYAQDSDGNIWYLGEDTYDGDKEGSFVAGCDGAEAGIVVLGAPAKGAFYQQEFYEDQAEDWGKVLNFILLNDAACMKTKEWSPLEPGHIEHKFYCIDDDTGEGALTLIRELMGKTVEVDFIGKDVVAAPAQAVSGQIDPEPHCP